MIIDFYNNLIPIFKLKQTLDHMINEKTVDDFKERIVDPITFDFKSRFEKRPEAKPKKKCNYLTRVGNLYGIYLKILLGR